MVGTLVHALWPCRTVVQAAHPACQLWSAGLGAWESVPTLHDCPSLLREPLTPLEQRAG